VTLKNRTTLSAKNLMNNKQIYKEVEEKDTFTLLLKNSIISKTYPLRLHLGCGETHLEGYVNIDYPPAEHTVQTTIVADVFADITKLKFPSESVEEIRSHHVFEHFDRPTALALLCNWQDWLKVGGRLILEVPDFLRSVRLIFSPFFSYDKKQVILRHIFGSHEASWAIHCDGWYKKKFERILSALGFDNIHFSLGKYHILRNITVCANKARVIDKSVKKETAYKILSKSMVNQSEQKMFMVWCSKFDAFLNNPEPMSPSYNNDCR
jgi:SAM-dependent methyltransferase